MADSSEGPVNANGERVVYVDRPKKKKPVFKRVWFWILVILILIVAGSAAGGGSDDAKKVNSGSSSNVESAKTEFKPGDVIAFDGKEVTVAPAERNWDSGNQFITPDSGNEYVKVQVSIKNNSDKTASYNTYDWKMQDSNGVIKDVDAASYGVDGALGSGELAPKGNVSGFLVFEVKKDDTGLVLKYNPSFFSDRKVEIKL